jgi:hypothetical protein
MASSPGLQPDEPPAAPFPPENTAIGSGPGLPPNGIPGIPAPETVQPVYRHNVILLSSAVIPVLMMLMMAAEPDFLIYGLSNIFVIYVLTVLLVYFDARRIGAGTNASLFGSTTPFWWFVLMIFLWIFAFPLYLLKRQEIFSPSFSVEGRYGELSRADIAGALVIPVLSPLVALVLAFYLAHRERYLLAGIVFLISLFSFIYSMIIFRGI